MNKVNYQHILDDTLEEIAKYDNVPTLLLHSCCAPCSSYVLEYLSQYFSITVLYYNPNIFPESEYEYRIREQERLIRELPTKNKVSFMPTVYTPFDYHSAIHGLEDEPEGGDRCTRCFELRLNYAAEVAEKYKFDFFTTTLSISPLKDAQRLNRIGVQTGEKYGVRYLVSDFKKNNGYKRSVELSDEYNLYRQDYCGCLFSYLRKSDRDRH